MAHDEVTPARVREQLVDLPRPGTGSTRARWRFLERLGRDDLCLAKVVEPHHDAVAILRDLDGPAAEPGSIWGVWAAEPPFAVLKAGTRDDRAVLTGTKAFCSGWGVSTHALVTAVTDDGPGLFAVRLDAGVRLDEDAPPWSGAGMRRARTSTLVFDEVEALAVGRPGDYVDRPGFWHGAIGVAAVWAGGTAGIAETLDRSRDRLDAHALAHLGAVRAMLAADEAILDRAARWIDAHPRDDARRVAQETRAVIAAHAAEVIDRVGRALGPGPLVADPDHATRVADLTVFVRQHHAERDLEALGRLP